MPQDENPFKFSAAFAHALSHPVRLELLKRLQGRTGTAKELARAVSVPANTVRYHLDVLREADCISLVTTEAIRGTERHIYTAKPGAFHTSAEWNDLPDSAVNAIASASLKSFVADFVAALEAPSGGQPESICVMETFRFDAIGWEFARQVIGGTIIQLRQLHEQCEAREYVTEQELRPAALGLSLFEPEPLSDGDDSA